MRNRHTENRPTKRWIGSLFALLAGFAFSPVILAQTAARPATTKTQSAVPDLSGVWADITPTGQTFNAKEDPSFTPWAEEKWKLNRNDNPGQEGTNGKVDRDPSITSCFPTGMPRLMTEVMPFEIVQVPGRVIVLFEKDYAVSHIWTDGRKLPDDPDPAYMGYSVGRWDGDTFVFETIGLKDVTWLDRKGHPHSDALRVTGRMRRVNHDRLEIDWTFDDPKAFTKPWTGHTVYRYKPDWILEEFISCEDRLLHGGESLEQKAVKGHVE